ncbi:MAG: hypothetical protein FWF88_09970 [Peptococcaceae bacterium]|jgi:hypothetical protein|nr:hypothetical protein [Peptococcaceae bacterium]MDR2735951.1 hypothetical protein [Gracilibacteraceae bacterium]
MNKKKVFGLTLEEAGRIKSSLVRWSGVSRSAKKQRDGSRFCDALEEGAKLLCEDKTFVEVFDVQR